jgi:hypothetical protein
MHFLLHFLLHTFLHFLQQKMLTVVPLLFENLDLNLGLNLDLNIDGLFGVAELCNQSTELGCLLCLASSIEGSHRSGRRILRRATRLTGAKRLDLNRNPTALLHRNTCLT